MLHYNSHTFETMFKACSCLSVPESKPPAVMTLLSHLVFAKWGMEHFLSIRKLVNTIYRFTHHIWLTLDGYRTFLKWCSVVLMRNLKRDCGSVVEPSLLLQTQLLNKRIKLSYWNFYKEIEFIEDVTLPENKTEFLLELIKDHNPLGCPPYILVFYYAAQKPWSSKRSLQQNKIYNLKFAHSPYVEKQWPSG